MYIYIHLHIYTHTYIYIYVNQQINRYFPRENVITSIAKHNAVIPEPVSYNVSLLSRISRGRETYTTLRFPPFSHSETYKLRRVRRITYCANFTDSSPIYQVLRKKTISQQTILSFLFFYAEKK